MNNIKTKYMHFYREVINTLRKPVMSVLPGHLSFFLLLSMIPIFLIFTIILSAFSIPLNNIVDMVSSSLPANTSKLIIPLLSRKVFNINLVFLIVSVIYLTSRGTKAIILSANNIYGVSRKSIQDAIKSIVVTILLIVLFLFMIIILILGGKIMEKLESIDKISFVAQNIINFFRMVRWPISIIIIFFTLKAIYTLTPNKKISFKSVNKGSLFTTFSWVIITYVYSFYVTHYSSYNTYYGGASNLIILMAWVYLISQVFVVGMVINSVEDKNSKID